MPSRCGRVTRVWLQLAAPRLILAESLDDPMSNLLILDLGSISVQPVANSAPAIGSEEDGNASAPSGRYDEYHVRLSSMQVRLARRVLACHAASDDSGQACPNRRCSLRARTSTGARGESSSCGAYT